ncbi:hypothetical protein LZ31DRAFT_197645 [Colletotrichum somersetense]|nr:hypothetical protein LZ31DRAFT_197645 [Colletotrichum somersetense]
MDLEFGTRRWDAPTNDERRRRMFSPFFGGFLLHMGGSIGIGERERQARGERDGEGEPTRRRRQPSIHPDWHQDTLNQTANDKQHLPTRTRNMEHDTFCFRTDSSAWCDGVYFIFILMFGKLQLLFSGSRHNQWKGTVNSFSSMFSFFFGFFGI